MRILTLPWSAHDPRPQRPWRATSASHFSIDFGTSDALRTRTARDPAGYLAVIARVAALLRTEFADVLPPGHADRWEQSRSITPRWSLETD